MVKRIQKCANNSYLQMIILLAALFFIWEQLAQGKIINTFFFSSPLLIWQDLLEMLQKGTLVEHTLVTLQEAAGGLIFGGLSGAIAAFLLAANKKISDIVMPIMVGCNGLPKLALGPLLIIWFGIGLKSKIVMSACMVFFIFLFNMYSGYNNVDKSLVNEIKLLGGTRLQVIRKVIWPSCLPWFFTSIRTGLGMSVTGAIVGEYIGSNKGLGYIILDAGGTYDISRVLCCILVLIVIMAFLDYFIKYFETLFLAWRPKIEN